MLFFVVVSWLGMYCGSVAGRAGLSAPVVTPAPAPAILKRQSQDPDAISLAQVLLTAVPESIRQVAATNIPAASSILNEQFFDDLRPWWFEDLPEEIQIYLIKQFGPATAQPTLTEAPSASDTSVSADPSQTEETSSAEETQTSASESSASSTSSETESMASESATESATATDTETSIEPSSSPTETSSSPEAPPVEESGSGLSKAQKVGLGLGIPLGLLAAAALLFACCTLLRRRRKKRVAGSIPPSSPGFIPAFAFHEKSHPNDRLLEQNPMDAAFSEHHNTTWDEEVIDTSSSGETVPTLNNPPQPIMAPALFHTHTSNRARGKRTSYTSLHSVAELSEPDDAFESPIIPRGSPPRSSPLRHSPKHSNSSRSLIPTPQIPAAATIPRKPVGSPSPPNPAAYTASQTLLRQTMPGPTVPRRPLLNTQYQPVASTSTSEPYYVSPIEAYATQHAFDNTNYNYEEDYGPEYRPAHAQTRYTAPSPTNVNAPVSHNNDHYVDMEDGLYGGNTSLSRYPETRRGSWGSGSKTEWPLRNFSIGRAGQGHRRTKSPLWERIYEE
ncbi:hypothetical protein M011DRAFT_322111 [Sporormia fimetaria CBS 119925]|uniref:Mid2 domain-containing protein n=1 Tax=Sporormia fimetaria CBS 119925 TaxID=1340428 RepID=A0A6A6VFL4_9PLEO|nr:hypothetical protein M011DRAFT_322111 [Sporormia fimetaria CBS 119925]